MEQDRVHPTSDRPCGTRQPPPDQSQCQRLILQVRSLIPQNSRADCLQDPRIRRPAQRRIKRNRQHLSRHQHHHADFQSRQFPEPPEHPIHRIATQQRDALMLEEVPQHQAMPLLLLNKQLQRFDESRLSPQFPMPRRPPQKPSPPRKFPQLKLLDRPSHHQPFRPTKRLGPIPLQLARHLPIRQKVSSPILVSPTTPARRRSHERIIEYFAL